MTSYKHQATSYKGLAVEEDLAGEKLQVTSYKHQATSYKGLAVEEDLASEGAGGGGGAGFRELRRRACVVR